MKASPCDRPDDSNPLSGDLYKGTNTGGKLSGMMEDSLKDGQRVQYHVNRFTFFQSQILLET